MSDFKDYHKHFHNHYTLETKWPSIAAVVIAVLVVWYFKTS